MTLVPAKVRVCACCARAAGENRVFWRGTGFAELAVSPEASRSLLVAGAAPLPLSRSLPTTSPRANGYRHREYPRPHGAQPESEPFGAEGEGRISHEPWEHQPPPHRFNSVHVGIRRLRFDFSTRKGRSRPQGRFAVG